MSFDPSTETTDATSRRAHARSRRNKRCPPHRRPHDQRHAARHRPKPTSTTRPPPMKFRPLQRFPAHRSRLDAAGLPHRLRVHLQVFSTSWRLLSTVCLPGLISCRLRSWGSTLQSLLPIVQLDAVVRHLVPSWRSTVASTPTTIEVASQVNRHNVKAKNRSCDFRALLHTTVRHHKTGGLDLPRARSSHGFLSPSRVFPLLWLGTALTVPPLTRLASPPAEATDHPSTSGSCCQRRLADLRRDCRPSWAS